MPSRNDMIATINHVMEKAGDSIVYLIYRFCLGLR